MHATPRRALAARALALALCLLPALPARAEESCASEPIAAERAVDFETAFTAALQRARSWQTDAAVVRLGHTTLGPLDAEGRSANWHMVFYSAAADRHDAITIADGTIRCWESPGRAGRVPRLAADFHCDVRKLLAEAATQGGAELEQQGYRPTLQLSAGADAEAFWYVNYEHPERGGALQVIFDANTGRFVAANR